MFHRTNIYDAELAPEIAHNGHGEILTHRIVNANNTSGACHFIDYTEMPPGTTIGQHSHSQNEEEYYLVLKGTGQMLANGESFPVKPGDLIRNPPGGTHGLKNTGSETLGLFVFEVTAQERND